MKAKILLLICVGYFFTSCEKDYLPDLDSEHCINVNIKGSVCVKPSEEKLNNIPVEVLFVYNYSMFSYEIQKVVSGKTNKNGEFDFKAIIDTTSFKNYYLCIRIPRLADYISFPYSGNSNYVDINFYDYDADALQKSINFELYKKVKLTINLKRTQTDEFEYFSVEHSFVDNLRYSDYLISSPTFATSEILQCETAADVYTKIRWGKRLKGDTMGSLYGPNAHIDSLICRQNSSNVFNINY